MISALSLSDEHCWTWSTIPGCQLDQLDRITHERRLDEAPRSENWQETLIDSSGTHRDASRNGAQN